MQDQPVVRIPAKGLGNDPVELGFNLVGRFSGSEFGSVADPEDMGVDCKSLFAKGGVEDHVGRLPADSGKHPELIAGPRNFAVILIDERPAEGDHILRLGIEEADGPDRLAQPLLAKIDHLSGRPDGSE
jgi:hypothetical protein